MDTICNSLKKLNPPPFVTVPVADSSRNSDPKLRIKPDRILWTLDNKIRYTLFEQYLKVEVDLLFKFIQRKGTQLRLEKALLLTKQISKVSSRWMANDFHQQLMNFKNGFPHKAKLPKNSDEYVIRVPSYQWLQWIIYLCLREVALLAKIKLECEKTVRYWFGLISSSHHWGDSLIIASLIARVWHLTSTMVDELNSHIYPFLYKLCQLIHATPESARWPDDRVEWKVPSCSLIKWLEESMELPFQAANLNRDLSSLTKSQGTPELAKILEKAITNEAEGSSISNILDDSSFVLEDEHNKILPYDEDFGAVILPTAKKKKAGTKNKAKKKSDETIPSLSTSSSENFSLKKEFKLRWKKFFKNIPDLLNTAKGRKQLLKRVKNYKLQNQADSSIPQSLNLKLGVKLIKLSKTLRNSNDRDKSLGLFQNFETFINKQSKKVKLKPKD